MARIVKKHDERKQEIINIAQDLFKEIGYNETSVSKIIEKANIAKGTFYHYFKSKDELLEAIVDETLNELIENAEIIVSNQELSSIEKLEQLFSSNTKEASNANSIKNTLHEPENRELHERINVQLILRLSPIVTQIVEQGILEGVFKLEYPLETVQILLVATQFLFEAQLFPWNQKELQDRQIALQIVIEKAFGAEPGSLASIVN